MDFSDKFIPVEIVEEIMLYLDRESLENVCNLNNVTAEICRDELFWKKKMLIDHNTDQKIPNKSYKESWIEYHRHLFKIRIGLREIESFGFIWEPDYDIPHNRIDRLKEVIKNIVDKLEYEIDEDLTGNINIDNFIMEDDGFLYLTGNIVHFSGVLKPGVDYDLDILTETLNEIFDENSHMEEYEVDSYEEQGVYEGDEVTVNIYVVPYFD